MQMAKRLCLDPAAVASSGACSSSGAASASASASFSAPPSSSGASCSIDKHAIGYKSLWEAFMMRFRLLYMMSLCEPLHTNVNVVT